MIRTKPEFAIKVNDLCWRFFELTCFVISWTLKYTHNDLFSVSYPNGYKSGLCFIVKMHCFLQIGGSWIKWVNILLIRPSNIILCMINLKRAQFYWYHCFEMITSPDWSYLSIIQKMCQYLRRLQKWLLGQWCKFECYSKYFFQSTHSFTKIQNKRLGNICFFWRYGAFNMAFLHWKFNLQIIRFFIFYFLSERTMASNANWFY